MCTFQLRTLSNLDLVMKDDLGVQTDRQAGSNASYAGQQGQGLMVLAGFDAQQRTGGGGLV